MFAAYSPFIRGDLLGMGQGDGDLVQRFQKAALVEGVDVEMLLGARATALAKSMAEPPPRPMTPSAPALR